MGGPNSGSKDRKRGDWESVARGRVSKQRDVRTTRGLTNVPKIGEVGSAAYRRMVDRLAPKQQHKRASKAA